VKVIKKEEKAQRFFFRKIDSGQRFPYVKISVLVFLFSLQHFVEPVQQNITKPFVEPFL
jgi:hypothetical protein